MSEIPALLWNFVEVYLETVSSNRFIKLPVGQDSSFDDNRSFFFVGGYAIRYKRNNQSWACYNMLRLRQRSKPSARG